jgi:uncharacterized protein YwqG
MSTQFESLLRDLNARIAAEPLLAPLNLPALARPAVQLVARQAPVSLGESRIGGAPDVPPGFEWPQWTTPKNKLGFFERLWTSSRKFPLGFIAQLDLSEMPRVSDALPDSGWLYFFYDRHSEPWGFDPADRGCCRVI